ncbi:hypothetical protein DKG74_19170 [Zavarzinia aquatilis]|uniref:HTH cro/C1-type domain-containing protein n=2 Tax=Zavarzinia aquatilis TaxID=2211142 RepID=A0A317DV49_9PROT|nr:hypothetical protein DKG74_19170 [Zavarzinia aquatilis]
MADRLEVPLRTYQNHESGASGPKAAQLQRLADIGCDIAWLITGVSAPLAPVTGRPQASDATIVGIPLYDARFSAGKGLLPPENEWSQDVKLPEDWVRRVTGRPPKNLIMAQAEGDSMEPTISSGDEMLIDITDRLLTNGKIYALSVAGTLLVKRIQLSVSGIIKLISDNKDYDPEEIDHNTSTEIQVIGQVVWWGHKAR